MKTTKGLNGDSMTRASRSMDEYDSTEIHVFAY